MTTITCNRRLWLAASPLALCIGLIATPAAAQEMQPAAETADEAKPVADPDQAAAEDSIVVTGFRRALENAINKKKNSEQIVESVSAEDIGKLPDASIAESIARLPGLTSQRLSGRSNNISIRGFAPDFSTTLLNGREQTSTGDNRAVEYDQYPSEIVNRVDVYKTPMASVVGQGLSGTVDLRTIRPLDSKQRIIAVGARGSYADLGKLNAGSQDKGYRLNALFVDQNDAGTLGVALGASYVDEPYQIQEFNAWGYPEVNSSAVVIGGSKSYITSTQLTRLGLNGTLQFRPDPRFVSTLDVFYSDFKDDQIKRGIELPLFWSAAQLQPGFTVQDGLVTSGRYTGVKGVVRNDAFQRKAKLTSIGWNNRWEGDQGVNLMGDFSISRTVRNELNVETYAGTGRGPAGATDTISFTSGREGTVFSPNLNYGDFNTILLTSPQGWGGNQTDTSGNRIVGSQDGYYNDRIVEDEIVQVRGEAEKEFETSFLRSIQLGLNYTDRSKSLTPDEYFLGLKANTNGTTSQAVPTQFRLGTSNLTYLGLGPVISYDPLALLGAGLYNKVTNGYPDVVAKNYSISEEVLTPYIQANIRADIGASQLTGNIGVQANRTRQSSDGTAATLLGFNANGSPNVTSNRVSGGANYWDVLPSANASLRMPGDFVVRVGLAREIVRPRLVDMRNSFDYSVSNGDPGDPTRFTCPTGRVCRVVRGNVGNVALRPFRANAVDVTFEKYFGIKGYLATQFFWKDLKSYIYKLDQPFNFTGFTFASPGTDNNGNPVIINPFGTVNQAVNGKGGKLYGVEVAGTLPLETFTSLLNGFGVTGGVSYTKTKVAPEPGKPATDLPGYSRWVANGTAYYENAGFSIRGSVRHRSSFIGEVTGFGGDRFLRRARPETIVDGQIGYDFGQSGTLQGLSLFLQGQNLTNEPFATTNPKADNQVVDYQRYGRRYLAGFNFRF
jgi:iron complex outermembrane receptor protein